MDFVCFEIIGFDHCFTGLDLARDWVGFGLDLSDQIGRFEVELTLIGLQFGFRIGFDSVLIRWLLGSSFAWDRLDFSGLFGIS